MTAETNHRQPRIWPWVLITVGLLLLAVVAILSNPSPSKPRIQVVYAGNVTSTDFEGETWAVFWATNSSSRKVMLRVTAIETNTLGKWYSYAGMDSDLLQPKGWIQVDGQNRKFHLTPPPGVATWRARFISQTEAKGWEIHLLYLKSCGRNLLHGYPLPRFPRAAPNLHVIESVEVLESVVVSPKR